MKKVSLILFVVLMLSACSSPFNKIQLDTLMTKEINISETDSLAQYTGVISVDTIKELSVNAVNTYLNQNIALDQSSIVVQFYESKTMETMITELIRKPYSFSYSNQIIDRLNEELVDGIFMVSIKNAEQSYRTILGGSSGQILEVSNQSKEAFAYRDEELSKFNVLQIGNQYVRNVIGADPSAFIVDCFKPSFSHDYEVYYRDVVSNEVIFMLEISPWINEVIRCSFGIWALLN